MGEKFSLIAFEEAGGQTHLYDEAQCAAAVAEGRVGPDTRVTVYQSGKSVAMNARDYPLFAALFAAAADAAARAAAEPEPSDELATDAISGTAASSEPSPESELEAAPPVNSDAIALPPPAPPVPEPEPEPGSEPPAAPEPSFRTLRNVVAGLILAFLVGWWISRQDPPSTDPIAPGPEASVERNLAEPAVDPEADIPIQTLYALREVNARSVPGSAGNGIMLPRGTALTGIIVSGVGDPNQSWLKIKIGRHSGRFVWTSNLGASEPPSLDTSLAGERTVYASATVRTEPSDDATPIAGDAQVSPGASLAVAGTVGSDWAEILLRRAGVGYVPASIFEKPPEEDRPDPEPKIHEILISNRCSDTDFEIALYYQTKDGWQTNDGAVWPYRAGQSNYPTYEGRRLQVISDTIYYAIISVNGKNHNFDGDTPISYGNRRISMQRAKIVFRSNGDYEIVIGC